MATPQLTPDQRDLVQETLLGEALEHAPVGAIVLDEEGCYLAANRLACRLTGYAREELLEAGARTLAVEPARLPGMLAAMASGELRTGTVELRRKDGTSFACEFRVGATRSGGLPFFVVIFWEPGNAEA